jgi:hypothetical protein
MEKRHNKSTGKNQGLYQAMTLIPQENALAIAGCAGNASPAAAPSEVVPRRDRRLWMLWLAFIFLLPLAPRTGENGILGSGWLANYLYTDFILLGVAASLILRSRNLANLPIGRQRYARAAFVFLLVLMAMQYVSLFFGVLQGSSFEPSYLGTGAEWCKVIAILLVSSWAATVSGGLKKAYRLFLVGFVLVCAIGLLEAANVGAVVSWLNRNYGTEAHVGATMLAVDAGSARLTSTFDRNPHGFAQYLGIGMTLFASSFFFVKRLSRATRAFLIVLFCVSAFLVTETKEMTGILFALVGFGVVLFYNLRRPGKRIQVALIALLIGIALIAGSEDIKVLVRIGAVAGQLSGSGAQGVDEGSFSYRYEMAGKVWDRVTRDPLVALFGTDPARFVQFTQSEIPIDSQYFYILFTLGFPGLIVFLGLFLFSFVSIHKKIKLCRDESGVVTTLLVSANAVICALLVANLSGAFSVGSTFARTSNLMWSIVGLALAVDPRGGVA